VKISGAVLASGAAGPGRAPEVDGEERTRDRVRRAVLEQGPVTAAQLALALGLTPAAVRRHLDVLLEQGVAVVHEPPPHEQRRRGRPARRFVLSDAGHAGMGSGYDDLASSALRFLADLGGEAAVEQFARQRFAEVEARYRPAVDAAGPDPRARAGALAAALSADGFAASTRSLEAGGRTLGTQLCQGHCPVHQVARAFPQLCEAEARTFSRLLGVHVQRLATLAHGEHVCTTHVPHGAEDRPAGTSDAPTERQSP